MRGDTRFGDWLLRDDLGVGHMKRDKERRLNGRS